MNSILTIASNTFREIIRDRILFGLGVFAVLLMGMSIALGELTYAEQVRISVNFGLAGIQLSSIILSVFIGSTLVAKEIEKQTVMTLLARPVSRTQFVWGKFFGLTLVNLVTVFLLACVLVAIVYYLKFSITFTFIVSLLGVCLESLVLLSATILFGMITKPLLAVSFSIGYALIGHWMRDLEYFSKKNNDPVLTAMHSISKVIFPDLEAFNWKPFVVYGDLVPLNQVGLAVAVALAWCLILLSLGAFIFRRKDFM